MKILKSLLIISTILTVISILVVGYFGFIPGLSRVLGSDRPRNLGVTYSDADYQSMSGKTGVVINSLPESTPATAAITVSGQRQVNASFTAAEMTAAINRNTWKYFPFTNVQIKINPDNSIEAAGLVEVNRLMEYAQAMGAKGEDIENGMKELNLPFTSFPFHAKVKGSVSNNKLNVETFTLEVGRFPLPRGIATQIQETLVPLVEFKLQNNPSISVQSASIEEGQAKFVGTLPITESVVKD